MRAPAALLALVAAAAVAMAAPAPGRSIAGAKRRRPAVAAASGSGRGGRRLVNAELTDPATNLLLPPQLPTRVYTSVVLNSLVKLDVMDSSFYADAYVAAAWVDPRLANATEYDPDTMFNPGIEYINRRDITEEPWVVHFDFPLWLAGVPGVGSPDDAWVIAETRIMGAFACEVSLRDFPQDVQTAYLAIESFEWNASRVAFEPVSSLFLSPALTVLSWRVLDAGTSLSLHSYPTFKESFSRATYWVRVKRQSDFYFFTVVASVTFLVVMAAIASVLRVNSPDRMSVLLAVFTALIAWEFVLAADTPKTGEITRLDSLMILAFVVVFVLNLVFAVLHFLDEASVRKRFKAAIAASKRNLLAGGPGSLSPISQSFIPGQPPPPALTASDRNMMLHRWDSSYIFEDELLAAAEEEAAEAEAAAAAAAAKKAEAERTHATAPAVARLGGASSHSAGSRAAAGAAPAASGEDGAFVARNPMHASDSARVPGMPPRQGGADGKFTAVPLMAVRTIPAGGSGAPGEDGCDDDDTAAAAVSAAQQQPQQSVRHRPASTGARAAAAAAAVTHSDSSSGSSEAISHSQATIPGDEDGDEDADGADAATAAGASAGAGKSHRQVQLQSAQRPHPGDGDRPPPLRQFQGKRPPVKPIECCCGRLRMRPLHVKEHRRVDFAIAGVMVLVYVIGAAAIFSAPTYA